MFLNTQRPKSAIAFALALAMLCLPAGAAPARASVRLQATDDFLVGAFVKGQYLEGFTPGKPDFGFSLEALLQREALGESRATLMPAVTYLLTDPSVSGDANHRSGYLFDSESKPKLGIIGKFAFVSAQLAARNNPTRKGVLNLLRSKIDRSGDFAPDAGANTYDRAWVVLGLAANGYFGQARWLASNMIKHQLKSGGFNDGYDLGVGSPDGTGIALQALAAVKDRGTASQRNSFGKSIRKAKAFLQATAVNGNHFESYGDANVNGTAYAAMGLTAVGGNATAYRTWLKTFLSSDGGISTPWSGGSGDVYATAQAALALLGSSYAQEAFRTK